jgi:hypothetical protein
MKFGMSNPRIYFHDEIAVPSVSTVTKQIKSGVPFNWPAFRAMQYVKDSMMEPDFNLEDILDEAMDDAERYMNATSCLGTAIHETLSQYLITGDKESYYTEDMEKLMDFYLYEKLLDNAFKWIEKYHVESILVEKSMTNSMYAGTLDLYCEIDSEAFENKRWCTKHNKEFPQPHRRVKCLLDWKVTKSYYDDMPVKLSAYWGLLEAYDYKPETALIVRFSRETGSLNVKDYTDEIRDGKITFDLLTVLFHHNFKEYLKKIEQEAERQRIAKEERKTIFNVGEPTPPVDEREVNGN